MFRTGRSGPWHYALAECAALEALVGDPKRIALVAAVLVAHFGQRVEAMDRKAMVVCMSRRIAVDLCNALIALRPDCASAQDDDTETEKGKACAVKMVMTGSAASSSSPHCFCIESA